MLLLPRWATLNLKGAKRMNRGIYPILSASLAQEHRIQVLTNNMANLRTTGFKRVEPVFEAILGTRGLPVIAAGQTEAAFQPVAGQSSWAPERFFVSPRDLATDFKSGTLRETKSQFDMAIKGDGFFEIKTAKGLVYTRNGMFHLDDQRRLVTEHGDFVMGGKGVIKLASGTAHVDSDGKIQMNGAVAGQVKVVEFPNTKALQQTGEGYFLGQNPKTVKEPSIAPGHLEESNVNAFGEMVKVIELMRTYESGQKAFQAFDRLNEVLIQDVGRVA